jgi:hypothetical protein
LEDALKFGIGVGCGTLGVEVVDVYIFELTGLTPTAHSLNKTLGGTCHRRKVNVVTRLNNLYCLIGSSKLDCIVHKSIELKYNVVEKY